MYLRSKFKWPDRSWLRKTLLVLKFSAILILIGTLQMSASVFSQPQKVKIKVENASLKEVLIEIREQSGVDFIFQEEQIAKVDDITYHSNEASIIEVLETCLQGTGLEFNIVDDIIVIKPSHKSVVKQQQQNEISGIVVDDIGEPMPGVNIIVKGKYTGTVTDNEGKFRIKIPDGPNTLIFSFIGFATMEIQVKGSQYLNVKLTPEISEMEEVVVNGIFTRKAESFTGSAITFKSEQLERVANSNVFESLKNLDPSLNIFSNITFGSDPNRLPEIQLRGVSTFPGSEDPDLRGNFQSDPNQPLFVLDGFEVSAMTVFDMDITRVSSITILKDAAAKAVYGSDAANGVVVIETKKPISGELKASYKLSTDLTMPDLTSYNLTNAAEKLEVEKIAGVYESGGTWAKQLQLEKLYNKRLKKTLEGDDTYWLSKPLQTGIGTQHALTIELGEQKTWFVANVAYRNTVGVMKESGRKNLSGSMTFQYRFKNLLFRNSATINSNNSEDSPYGSFGEYSRMNPYWDAYNEDGTVANNEEYDNPLYNATINTSLKSSYFEFRNNFFVEWTIIEGLKARARCVVTKKTSDSDRFYPANHTKFNNYSTAEMFRKGSYQLNNGTFDNVGGDLNIQYSKTIDKHFVMGNLGFNIGENSFSEVVNYAEGFPSDKMNDITFALQYAKNKKPYGTEGITRDIGFLGVAGYTYDDRFLCDLTIRKNASSQFGANKRWGTFWSFGLGWNLHHESFFKSSGLFKQLKIRGSVGTSGSQNFNSYQALSTYKYYLDRSYNGQLGAYVKSLANEDLQWQQKLDLNAGLDAKIGNLSMRIDFYQSFTENLITALSIPTSIGYSTILENIGRVKNEGIEFNASYKVFHNKNGFLSLNIAGVSNKNKILNLSDAMRRYNEDQDKLANKGDYGRPVLRYVEGGSMTSIWAVPSLGIDPTSGQEIYLKQDGTKTFKWNPKDQIIAGNSLPALRGNLGLNGEIHGFGLSVVARYWLDSEMYNSTLANRVENIDPQFNVDRRVLSGRWQNPGDYSAYKTLRPYADEENNLISTPKTRATTRFVQKRSDLDISSVSLYYEFKKHMIERFRLQRLKLMFNMNNVHTFSTIKVERGLSYPFARTMSFTLKVTL